MTCERKMVYERYWGRATDLTPNNDKTCLEFGSAGARVAQKTASYNLTLLNRYW